MKKYNPFKIQEGSIEVPKLRTWRNYQQEGDYFEIQDQAKRQSLGRFLSDRKIRITFNIFVFLLVLLLSRSFYLQIVEGSTYRGVAEGNRIKQDIVLASRGLIYDRYGNQMVKNVSYFFLYIDPGQIPEDKLERLAMMDRISKLINADTALLEERLAIDSKGQKILVYENLSYNQALELMLLEDVYPAMEVSYEPRRQYLASAPMPHAMGYMGAVSQDDIDTGDYQPHDRIGKTGLEQSYQTILRGIDGERQIEVDALNREKNIISQRPPVDGDDIKLTIDAAAQKRLTEIMDSNARIYDKPKMAVVVMDPKDGGVLAIHSMPTFDNNIFTTILNKDDYQAIISDENNPLLNRVVSGTYPLGSVFKTVMGAAALQEKIIDTNFTVNSVGGITVGNSFFPDWRAGGHGRTNIYWAIADSVNTFFYSIGGGNNQWLQVGLGADKILEYAAKFGLSKPTGIDLAGEASGFLPSKEWKEETLGERWYLGDTYNLSIGQGFMLATPLQAAEVMSYYANNGTAYKPHLLMEVIDSQGQVRRYEPEVALTDIVSSDNFSVIRQAMRQTVTQGTAQSMQSVPVAVAGKTGTAQFNRNKIPHSWFAGFAPYDDPQVVIVTLVEEGGDIGLAVKVSREFLEWYFSE